MQAERKGVRTDTSARQNEDALRFPNKFYSICDSVVLSEFFSPSQPEQKSGLDA